MHLTIDFETRSRCNLKKADAWKYAEDSSTEVMCLSVKVDNKPARIWLPPYWSKKLSGLEKAAICQIPVYDAELSYLISQADTIEAHNAGFEAAIWYAVMHLILGFLDIPPEKWRCSASRAAMCALPRALGQAGAVLGLPIQKDLDGHQIMMKFCKPKKTRTKECSACKGYGKVDELECVICEGRGQVGGEEYWHEDTADFVKLCQYCLRDTESEYALSQALPPLPPKELALWQLDQRMNRAGVRVDVPAVNAWIGEIAKEEKKLLTEWYELTGKKVKSPKQTAATLAFFKTEFGLDLPDLQKDTIAGALEDLGDLELATASLAEPTEPLEPEGIVEPHHWDATKKDWVWL